MLCYPRHPCGTQNSARPGWRSQPALCASQHRQHLVPWSPSSLPSDGSVEEPLQTHRDRSCTPGPPPGTRGENPHPRDVLGVTVTPSCRSPGSLPAGIDFWGRGAIICGVFSSPTMAFHGRCIVPDTPALFLRVHQFSFTCHGAGGMEKGKEGKGGGQEGQTQPRCSG